MNSLICPGVHSPLKTRMDENLESTLLFPVSFKMAADMNLFIN